MTTTPVNGSRAPLGQADKSASWFVTNVNPDHVSWLDMADTLARSTLYFTDFGDARPLYVADFALDDDRRSWDRLQVLQHREDAGDEQQALAETFRARAWHSVSAVKTLFQVSAALPDSALPQVMTVVNGWSEARPNVQTIASDLHFVWEAVHHDDRPAVASFARVLIAAARRGANARHLAGLVRLRVAPRLRALLSRVRTGGELPLVPPRLASHTAERGPPVRDGWSRRVGPLEVIATA